MIERPLSQIASAVRGTLRGPDAVVSSVETDSRAVAPGSLFVAIEGERADGHAFVEDAFARGAVAALVHRPGVEGTVIEVPATGRALLDLAADERDRMTDARVVAITGSNGKTSTKDLAAAVVGTRLRTHASPASFNNEVGLPMTLLGAEPGVEVVVAEMGARREGDVRLLCDVARPDAVVVTNVGTAHLGIFGSWDAIVRAGAEPVEWLGADGTAIVNADDPVVARLRRGHRGGRDHVRSGSRRRRAGRGRRARSRRAGGLHPRARPANASRWSSPSRASTWCRTPSPPPRSAGRAGVTLAECATALKGAGVTRWRMETFTGRVGDRAS